MKKRYIVPLLILVLFSCKTKKISPNDSSVGVVVMDSTQAAKAIVTDKFTSFFDDINRLDMSIQTRQDLSNYPRTEALNIYKSYLQQDVDSFTEDESKALQNLFKSIKNTCDLVSKDIFPPHLSLIKTKSKHYGPGMYYTRNESIIIPYETMGNVGSIGFRNTMIHEIFHIYSRLHLDKRKSLYKLIGFETVSSPDKLAMVAHLKDKILLNPDGVNYATKIQLTDGKNHYVDAFPIIFSNSMHFTSKKHNFFEYISFDLFEVKSNAGRYEVVSDTKGNSTLDPTFMNSFFDQIKDNTQYTIHPDEILADNFALLMGLKESKENKVTFSKEGEILIKEIERVISK